MNKRGTWSTGTTLVLVAAVYKLAEERQKYLTEKAKIFYNQVSNVPLFIGAFAWDDVRKYGFCPGTPDEYAFDNFPFAAGVLECGFTVLIIGEAESDEIGSLLHISFSEIKVINTNHSRSFSVGCAMLLSSPSAHYAPSAPGAEWTVGEPMLFQLFLCGLPRIGRSLGRLRLF